MRMGNPALRKTLSRAQKGEIAVEVEPATHGGIARKSVLFAALTVVSAVATMLLLTHAIQIESERLLSTLLISAGIGAFLMLVLSVAIMFAPAACGALGSVYSVCQGVLLGIVVCLINSVFPGVAFAAILGTIIVFVLAVVLNKALSVRISNRLWRSLFIAFLALIAVEVIMLIVSLFNGGVDVWANFWIQLGITVFCVFYASVMLMWDLQTADDVVNVGADKRYEWLVAFSLVTTLVYLYLEILELLVRLIILFGDRN